MDIAFFKSIYTKDVIYHYTKASTAIDFILHNSQLKFGSARKSSDPIESSKARRSTFYSGANVDRVLDHQHCKDVNELHDFVESIEGNFHQICFCQNVLGSDFSSEYYHTKFEGKEELFGFTKLRMWDQYADQFSGVCLAFSKEKLLARNSNRVDLITGDVKYLTFEQISLKKVTDISGNYLLKVPSNKYKKQLEKRLKKSLFFKHKDYATEKEYRIGTLFDKSKCSFEISRGKMIFDRIMMLDITDCIVAIFVSSYANNKQK